MWGQGAITSQAFFSSECPVIGTFGFDRFGS